MYKLRPFLPLKVMKNVYYSLIYSHIIYAIEVWGSTFKTELNKILILQKRALRLMAPGPLYPSDPIFSKLNMFKVSDIHKYQVLKFVFKSTNMPGPEQFHDWFHFNHERHFIVVQLSRLLLSLMKEQQIMVRNNYRLMDLGCVQTTTTSFVFLKSLITFQNTNNACLCLLLFSSLPPPPYLKINKKLFLLLFSFYLLFSYSSVLKIL